MPLNLTQAERAHDRSAGIEYDRLFAAHDEIETIKRAYIDDAAINGCDDFTELCSEKNAATLAEINRVLNSREAPGEKLAQVRAVMSKLIDEAADAYAHRMAERN